MAGGGVSDCPTVSSLRKRAARAVGELVGNVSEPLPARTYDRFFGAAMDRVHGRALGMSPCERWYQLDPDELEQTVDALEERAAIVHFNDQATA